MGRYFIRTGGRVKGPLDAGDIVLLHQFGPDFLLCPEGSSPKSRDHWRRAATFPEVMACRIQSAAAPRRRPIADAVLDPAPAPVAESMAPSAPVPSRRPLALGAVCAVAALIALSFALVRHFQPEAGRDARLPVAPRVLGDSVDEGAAALAASETLSRLLQGRGLKIGEARVFREGRRPFEIHWDTHCGAAVLKRAGKAGEFSPANDAARRLLDGRDPCR
ncbi:MAG: hypothetical protein A2X36_05445 [Elusimicrobia bacterium GWA2_69_24]|nr:MAG: hypothetical protein A2X36_05445 [Elusimicrobia bacterium GWA2_69_24]HBL16001.1 hypothetical protein [Elusimicrobiota bacterium]